MPHRRGVSDHSRAAVQPETMALNSNPEKQQLVKGPVEGSRWQPRGIFHNYVRPAVAEFFGVGLFVLIGCLVVQPAASPTTVALAHGLTIAALVTALGRISGGHFNPAVTLSVVLSNEIPVFLSILYLSSQILGGIVGAAIVKAIESEAVYLVTNGGAHSLGPDVTPGLAIFCEALLTLILVSTVLLTAVDPKPTIMAPLAIGMAMVANILVGIKMTGASMNPARSFGPAVVANHWPYHYVYWVGPAIGSITATFIYKFFLAAPHKLILFPREEEKEEETNQRLETPQ